MKRVLLIALPVLLALPAAGFAQETPKLEVFGGYSFFHSTDFIPTFGFAGDFGKLDLHGWEGSVAANLNSWFGVEGDFSGHYGSPSFAGFSFNLPDVSIYTFMGGPKLAYRGSQAFTPYAHFLIGGAHANAGVFGFGVGENALAAAVGGGLDIRLGDHVAVRAVQADYLMTRFLDYRQNNIRLSAGIVFRF